MNRCPHRGWVIGLELGLGLGLRIFGRCQLITLLKLN